MMISASASGSSPITRGHSQMDMLPKPTDMVNYIEVSGVYNSCITTLGHRRPRRHTSDKTTNKSSHPGALITQNLTNNRKATVIHDNTCEFSSAAVNTRPQ